jgi:hypothetical protein
VEAAPDVPEELARVVAGLMAASPDERFASAGEAALAIRAWLSRQMAAPAMRALGEAGSATPVGRRSESARTRASAEVATVEPLSWLADHAQAPTPPPLPPAPHPVAPLAEVAVEAPVVDVEPVIPTVEVERVTVAAGPSAWERPPRPVGIDRRDLLLLLAGAGALLAVQLLAWSLARLLSLLRRPPRDSSDEDKQAQQS